MATAVKVRTDFSAAELRRVAAASKHANQSRRLLSIAAVLDGMSRAAAARIGGMDRQTLRDWVHRFNESGPEGLKDSWSKGHPPRLSAEQLAQFGELVETGPDRAVHGVVRWRRVDLQQIVAERFGVAYHERTIGKILKQLGFSHLSARPRHPAQDEETVAAFKKFRRDAERASRRSAERQDDRDLVPGRGPYRPEERPRTAVGAARLAPTPARRSAVRKRLPVRRHLSGAAPMLCSCSTAPAGTRALAWSCRRTSPSSSYPRALPSSTRSRTSGSTCARTGSQTACSRPTTPSSKRLAKPGAASSPSPPPSAQSDTATGRTWVENEGRWYDPSPGKEMD